MASFPDVKEVSSMLKRHSRFFTEIRSVTEALENLDHFLHGADSKSVEKLMSEFTESLLDQTEESVEEECLAKLLQILQERRVVDFLSSAGRRTRERSNQKLVYSFVNEYFDSSEKDVLAWLTEEAPASSILSLQRSSSINTGRVLGVLFPSRMAPGESKYRYWIDVSGLYKLENLLKIMGEQLGSVIQERSSMALIDKLTRHSVHRNRYMFVLDDVFHQEFWRVIKQALRDSGNCNLIITKTTDDEVVSSFKQGSLDQVLKLGPLSKTESWELFCRITFQDEPEQRCPAELQLLSEEIVKMCKGFPLPIVGISSLLSKRERKELEWKRVRNGFNVEVKTNPHLPRFLDVPPRSYFHGLHIDLLQCFMYFGVFPRDSVIPCDKLYKMWIAEGFIEQSGEKTLEEVAEEYLNKLIRRNLVHSFQGHNRFEEFCRVGRLMNYTTPISPRRSICTDENVDPRSFHSELQSLFVYGGGRDLAFLTASIRQCEKLTVLDFEYHPVEQLPEGIGKLIHLKYLSLKNTKLRKLPKAIEKLINLETLDVRNTLLVELPVEINMLNNLRHLLANLCDDGISVDPTQGVRLKKGIGRLHQLHTLTTVEAHDNGIVKEIAALDQLRTLGMSKLTAKTVKALSALMGKLGHLKSLNLQAKNGYEVLDLARVSSPLLLLQRLVLKGVFQNLPNWIFHLQNLSVLCLSLTPLTEDQLIQLSHLPNLVSLWLCRLYTGDQLYFKQEHFDKLKLLVIREFHGLQMLEIEDGALFCLEELRIGSSPLLNEVPSGIQYLKNLRILINYDMPKEFVVRMQPNGGSDYWKVEHICSVFFLYRVEGREYNLFELGDPELVEHFEDLATNAYRITEPQDEHAFTFCQRANEDTDDIGPLRFYKAKPTFLHKNSRKWSFSSGMLTDDVEE